MHHKERFKLIAAVHLLLIKEGSILLLRRFNTGYEDGNYSVPAGHLDGGEKASDAMMREAKEEAGITIAPKDLSMVHVMHWLGDDERMQFFFFAKKWQGEIKNMEPEKCDNLEWFSINDLPKNMVPYVRAAISHYLNNNNFSEFGWD